MKLKLFMLMMLIFLGGCTERGTYNHKFQQGDYVRVKLDCRIGVVLFRGMRVTIRFGQDSYVAPLLGGKIRIAPYSTVAMYEWEVERYNKEALPCPR